MTNMFPAGSEQAVRVTDSEEFDSVDWNANTFSVDCSDHKRTFIKILARDYIFFKVYGIKKESHVKAARTLRRVGSELEDKYNLFFDNICRKLEIRDDNAEIVFKRLSQEVLGESINWGRLVSIFVLGGKLAKWYHDRQRKKGVGEVIIWLTDSIMEYSQWIERNGGWDAFVEQFADFSSNSWYSKGLMFAIVFVSSIFVLSALK